MKHILVISYLWLVIGCNQATNSSGPATITARNYIDGWDKAGMWLPDESQVQFFHSHLADSDELLKSAFANPSYQVRMRAAYVIDKIGPDAYSFVPGLTERLQNEPDRLVRMYLYKALRGVRSSDPATVEYLKQRFTALDETNQQKESGQSESSYLDADEKVCVAEALCVLDKGPDRKKYLDFILKWLQKPDQPLTPSQRSELWERRWGAVLALENMPDAAAAIPLLEALVSERDAPMWVSVHVPRVLKSLKDLE